MRHKVNKIIPESAKMVVSHTTCDICKRSNRGKGSCDLSETEISFRDVETSYPECGNGTTYTFDICHQCFSEKLIPALSELGAEPTIEEWDY